MIRVSAPAKLNLYLRVLGERPDGYHELETVFERIDLADELTFKRKSKGLFFSCDDQELEADKGNLVLKAARLLQETVGTSQGARIHLRKRIPIAAGLGGGSSDAASTLLGLNELWQLHLEPSALLQLGARLGSDVPFFLSPTAFAIGRGRGELCEPVPQAGRLVHILVVPEARLSSRDVYEGLQQRADSEAQFGLTASEASITIVVHALSNGSLSELATGLWNDLEPEAIRRCPISALIQLRLQEYKCLGTLVSGSGPAVFGLCHDLAHAQDVAAALRDHAGLSWRIEVVQTMHPTGSMVMSPA